MSEAPLRLALVGYGHMGRLLDKLAPEHGFEVVLRLDEFNNQNGEGITKESLAGVDVAVDFSIPDVVPENAVRIAGLGVPQAIGTTGWLEHLSGVREAVEANQSALVYGANYSIGVNAFYRIVREAARTFAAQQGYDGFLYEAHHKFKKDAPSGTALRLLDAVRGAGYERHVDVCAQRAGYSPGVHEIGFDSEADTISLRHTARSRMGFALGALKAARWIVGQRGVYDFAKIWDRVT